MTTLNNILDFAGGDIFYRFGNADDKYWVVPAIGMHTAMHLYQPSGIKGKMVKSLLPCLHWIAPVRKAIKAKKIKSTKKFAKKTKFILLMLLLFLLGLYLVVSVIYNNGNFSITLDDNLYYEKSLIIYDNPDYKVYRSELYAPAPESFDNISYRWLPDDLYLYEGSNNGENYLSYSFYIENTGEQTSDYWTELVIDDVIKNVDEAVRVRVFRDDEEVTTYAKLSAATGKPEKGTVAFVSDELITREHVTNFKPGDISKFTVVMWVEGSDLECTDNILGGEFKVHLDFKSEFIDEEKEVLTVDDGISVMPTVGF